MQRRIFDIKYSICFHLGILVFVNSLIVLVLHNCIDHKSVTAFNTTLVLCYHDWLSPQTTNITRINILFCVCSIMITFSNNWHYPLTFFSGLSKLSSHQRTDHHDDRVGKNCFFFDKKQTCFFQKLQCFLCFILFLQ